MTQYIALTDITLTSICITIQKKACCTDNQLITPPHFQNLISIPAIGRDGKYKVHVRIHNDAGMDFLHLYHTIN